MKFPLAYLKDHIKIGAKKTYHSDEYQDPRDVYLEIRKLYDDNCLLPSSLSNVTIKVLEIAAANEDTHIFDKILKSWDLEKLKYEEICRILAVAITYNLIEKLDKLDQQGYRLCKYPLEKANHFIHKMSWVHLAIDKKDKGVEWSTVEYILGKAPGAFCFFSTGLGEPVVYATYHGHLEWLKKLYELWPKIPDHILEQAAYGGDLATAEWLIEEKGHDVNHLIEYSTQSGRYYTALHGAVRGLQLDMLKFLIKKGANIKLANEVSSLVDNCEIAAHEEVMEILLPHLRQEDIDRTLWQGCSSYLSPLTMAVRSSNVKMLKNLINHGATIKNIDIYEAFLSSSLSTDIFDFLLSSSKLSLNHQVFMDTIFLEAVEIFINHYFGVEDKFNFKKIEKIVMMVWYGARWDLPRYSDNKTAEDLCKGKIDFAAIEEQCKSLDDIAKVMLLPPNDYIKHEEQIAIAGMDSPAYEGGANT